MSHRESILSCKPVWSFWIIFLAVAIILSCQLQGCKKAPPQGHALRAIPVTVIKAEPRDVPVSFEFVAQTQSSHEVEIRARVNGFLDKRVYTEGDMVKEGQVLFIMDKKPFQATADGAAASLAKQKAAMENARANLERVKPLVAQNALSQKDLDDATGSYEMSSAAVEQAKTQLQEAQLNLSYCTIASPLSGISAAALQQEGAYISQTNSHLTTVSALSPLWVNFSLSENDIKKYNDQVANGQLRPPRGQNFDIEIILVDGSIFPYTGKIIFASPSYNPKTGTFLLRASVSNPGGHLRPNQYVRVRLKGAVRPNAIILPQRAVQQGAKGHFVWVVNKEDKAELRPVVVGDWHGNDVFITEGLGAGGQVVVEGGLTLQPGAPVQAKQLAATPDSGKVKTPVSNINKGRR